ncbi:MAG: ribosomal protein [Acidimicrobiia bacterium]|jgi:large subunit ribosomal protein L29|nr:ribosomal protein [Acidimicrobiia bacterium]
MTPSEIREMTDTELIEALAEAKEEKFNLRFQLATNQLDNHARIKAVKQDIARILTVLHERQLATVDVAAGTEEGA